MTDSIQLSNDPSQYCSLSGHRHMHLRPAERSTQPFYNCHIILFFSPGYKPLFCSSMSPCQKWDRAASNCSFVPRCPSRWRWYQATSIRYHTVSIISPGYSHQTWQTCLFLRLNTNYMKEQYFTTFYNVNPKNSHRFFTLFLTNIL